MKKTLIYISTFVCLLPMARVAQGQGVQGARALGMGGAFTAVADGDTAAYWNPAAAAGQRGTRLLAPNLGLLFSDPASFSQAVSGFGSNWNDRMALAQRWSQGATNFAASAYTGLAVSGTPVSLSAFGKGVLMPTDFDGTPGHLTLTPMFSSAALHDAAVKEYTALGDTQANANQDADKIVQQVQKTFPGAKSFVLPAYKSKVVGQADVYGAGFVTLAQQPSRNIKIGFNLKLVAAERFSARANFGGVTLTDKLAQRTGGTASPALVDRVLQDLNLRKPDGSYFAGRELAGDAAWQTVSNGVELRPSLDAGALWRVNRRTQMGLVVRNLVPAHFTSAAPLNTYLDAGIAHVLPRQRILLAADLTNVFDSAAARLNVGMEWQPIRGIALRTGLYHGRATYGLGIGNLFSVAVVEGMSQLSFGFGY